MRTWLTERFGLTVPVVAAPMAGVSTGRLAEAVSAAGGLGMIGAGPTSKPDWLREQCAVAREAGQFGVGLMAWALAQDDALVDVVVAEEPALVSVSYGPYERWIPPLRAAGIVVATQVGTLEEAWVGTAFLACTEAATSAGAREQLLAAKDTDTAYGRVFDVGQRMAWPSEYGGRALRNAYFDRWVGHEDELAGDDAASAQLVAARQHGDFDVACVYAGEGVGLLRDERAAADVVAEFAGAGALLDRAAGQ